jgi:hypothetical protein
LFDFMKHFAKSFIVVLTLALGITLIVTPQTARAATAANTPPPPGKMSIQGFFDPSFKYLDQGNSSILDNGNQTANISVTTVAKQLVASIGANVYLDRWNGSVWVQVNSVPAQLSSSNTNYLDGYCVFSITSGYYYRARTQHWVINNGVYEQGDRTTASILAK